MRSSSSTGPSVVAGHRASACSGSLVPLLSSTGPFVVASCRRSRRQVSPTLLLSSTGPFVVARRPGSGVRPRRRARCYPLQVHLLLRDAWLCAGTHTTLSLLSSTGPFVVASLERLWRAYYQRPSCYPLQVYLLLRDQGSGCAVHPVGVVILYRSICCCEPGPGPALPSSASVVILYRSICCCEDELEAACKCLFLLLSSTGPFVVASGEQAQGLRSQRLLLSSTGPFVVASAVRSAWATLRKWLLSSTGPFVVARTGSQPGQVAAQAVVILYRSICCCERHALGGAGADGRVVILYRSICCCEGRGRDRRPLGQTLLLSSTGPFVVARRRSRDRPGSPRPSCYPLQVHLLLRALASIMASDQVLCGVLRAVLS